MERAIAYIRVSSDRQVKDGSSLATQERRVREYAASKGYELAKLFVEEGETAKTDDRTELQAMLTFAREQRRRFQVLIFPKVDRFARYTEDYFHLKRTLRVLGIRVESADEGFDDSPTGRFMEGMLAATAQFDNDIRAERSKAGMREAVLQGRWVWGAPCGYRNTRIGHHSTIEPDPVVGPLVAEAFRRLTTGQRMIDVRSWLNAQGIKLSRSRFYKMITSRAYIGIIDAFGVTQIAIPPFLPLVSEAVFRKAGASIRSRPGPKVYERDRIDFPLRGTVRCSCGRFLTASWSRGRVRRYPYYRCKDCVGINLPPDCVEQQWLRALRAIADEYSFTAEAKAEWLAAWDKECSMMRRRWQHLSREVTVLGALQKAIALKNAQGVLPDELAREQIAELAEKQAANRCELEELRTNQPSLGPALVFAEQFLPDVERWWRAADLPAKKHIQRFFFPQGGTIVADFESRTARTGLSTGKEVPSDKQLSRLVPHDNIKANLLRGRNKPKSRRERISFLLKLYEEFGGSPDASSAAPAGSK